MGFVNFQAIIDFAIEKEKEAAAFYEVASEMAKLAGAREMLKEFAAQERKHQSMLENIEEQTLSGYDFKPIADLKRSDYLTDIEYEEGMGYRDILRIGMKREEKSKALYTVLEKHAPDANTRKLFKILVQEESKHKQSLETLYDDLMAQSGD